MNATPNDTRDCRLSRGHALLAKFPPPEPGERTAANLAQILRGHYVGGDDRASTL